MTEWFKELSTKTVSSSFLMTFHVGGDNIGQKRCKGGILMFREQNARMSCFKAWKSGVKPTHLEISFLHK